jgi:2-keto-4-pentenoate hydratase/2-oxohepta-3-ene-1,7-dioic acid hydratase in catechol pathway
MRLVTYRTNGSSSARPGLEVDGAIVDLQRGAQAIGTAAPSSIRELLEQKAAGMDLARAVADVVQQGDVERLDASTVTLGPALPNPASIYLLAGNYQSHITEGGAAPVQKSQITPRPFIKPGTAVIGTGDPIVIPPDSDTLDYEIEIAAVVGRGGKHIPLEQANDHIAGYMVFNDVSARSLKIAEGRDERNGDWFFDWLLGKWCDGFAVVGPYLVTRDEAGEPNELEMALKVNGELRQHSSAGEMIFSIPETVAFLSRFVTLRPGDLLCMGTPGGVGDTTQTYLQPGDVVEATIERLGSLTNTVTRGNA